MAPLIRAVLSSLIGEEDAKEIDIVSNDVRIDENGKWHIVYRHPSRYAARTLPFKTVRLRLALHSSGFGHDKSQAILPYRDLPHSPTLFFFGDGVSGKYRYFMLINSSETIPFQICLLPATLTSYS